MKKIWRDRWLEWLETPGRPQAWRLFYDSQTGCYCATGGLIQLLIDAGVSNLKWSPDNLPTCPATVSSPPLLWWEEVSRVTGVFADQLARVLEMNDVANMPFPEIAAWVRSNVPEEA